MSQITRCICICPRRSRQRTVGSRACRPNHRAALAGRRLKITKITFLGEGRELAERLATDVGLRRRLTAYAWRQFGIPASDTADIFQETCVSLLSSHGHINIPEAFVFKVFHGRCCAALGTAVTERRARPGPEEPFGDQSPEDSIWLRKALTRLSPRRLELIHAYFFEGHSLKETARRCGVAETSVWTLLSRSVECLRIEMIGRPALAFI